MPENPREHPAHPAENHQSSGTDSQRALILAAMQQARRAGSRTRSARDPDSDLPRSPLAGADSIPGYRLLREIHRGGQGVVYQAVQEATQRIVAVKVMRDGVFGGPSERARFEREVQLLAELDHPSIVTIHDSGSAAGAHYFVMDYVRGKPLDAYLHDARPDLRQTLELFAKICEAVEAAHLRGIIHRDLKPGNIRVEENGNPRVLDFGLAKRAWDAGPAGATIGGTGGPSQTITGQFVGSLPWASPEQARGESARVDLRSDVYSLGVVLYQMLTGLFPYEVSGPAADVLRRIVEEEPARPSSRRGRLACDDEADTIALKCLAKDRERRYQSAGDLARDVRRALAGEPIDAKRDSVSYVLRKQLRRYRVAVAVSAAILALLVIGLAASLTLWRTAERHRAEAEFQLGETKKAERAAGEQAELARAQTRRAQKVLDLLILSFRGADPKHGGSLNMSAAEALKRGADAVVNTLGSSTQELVTKADLYRALGDIYRHLGELPRARDYLEQALALHRANLAPDRREIVETQRAYADVLMELGEGEAAARHYHAILEAMRSRLSRDDWHLVEGWAQALRSGGLPREAESVLRDYIDRILALDATAGDAAEDGHGPGLGNIMAAIVAINTLAQLLEEDGRAAEAVPLMDRALDLCAKLPELYSEVRPAIQNNLAYVLLRTGDLARARSLAEESLRWRTERLPPDHLDIASSRFVLGSTLLAQSEPAAARDLLVECLRVRSAALAPEDSRVTEAAAALESAEKLAPPH